MDGNMSHTKGELVLSSAYQTKEKELQPALRLKSNGYLFCTFPPPKKKKDGYMGMTKKQKTNAHLIIAASPMDMLLSLLASGEARFEHGKTTDLVEFCWKGLRYACSDCDWAGLVKTIGLL